MEAVTDMILAASAMEKRQSWRNVLRCLGSAFAGFELSKFFVETSGEPPTWGEFARTSLDAACWTLAAGSIFIAAPLTWR